MILQSRMLWSRSLPSQNRKTLILLTRTLTLTTVGSPVSQNSKQHRIGTGQLHPHTISLQGREKAKVKEFRNLPATEIEAKMTGSSMTADTISHAPVRAHFFQKIRAAIAGRQDTGAMSIPPSLAWPLSIRDRAPFLPRNGERDKPSALRRQRPMPC